MADEFDAAIDAGEDVVQGVENVEREDEIPAHENEGQEIEGVEHHEGEIEVDENEYTYQEGQGYDDEECGVLGDFIQDQTNDEHQGEHELDSEEEYPLDHEEVEEAKEDDHDGEGQVEEGQEVEEQHEEATKTIPFPLTRIKRIVKLDKDIKLVNRPALIAISHAAELFIENLVTETFSVMLTSKHKSMRNVDVEAAVKSKRKFLDFLDDSMDIFRIHKDAGNDSHEEEGDRHAKAAKKVPLPPPGIRCITDFFGNSA